MLDPASGQGPRATQRAVKGAPRSFIPSDCKEKKRRKSIEIKKKKREKKKTRKNVKRKNDGNVRRV